eukprot:2025980-Pleurochrysis_carterae.AAC.1
MVNMYTCEHTQGEPIRRLEERYTAKIPIGISSIHELSTYDYVSEGALLEFALGNVWLRTVVYVFDKLVEMMPLGASSIVEHGLVVDGASMLLRRGTPLQIVPSESVPLLSSHAKMKGPPQ